MPDRVPPSQGALHPLVAACLLGVALLLPGCDLQRKIQGQVFIINSAASTERLSRVPLFVVEKSMLRQRLTDPLESFEEEKATEATRDKVRVESLRPLKDMAEALSHEKSALDTTTETPYGPWRVDAKEVLIRAEQEVQEKTEFFVQRLAARPVDPLWQRLVAVMPPSVAQSDADGRFEIRLPAKGDWYLVAHTTTKDHTPKGWFIPAANVTSPAYNLNNDNTSSEAQLEASLKTITGTAEDPAPTGRPVESLLHEVTKWVAEHTQAKDLALEQIKTKAHEATLAVVHAQEEKQRKIEEEIRRKKEQEVAIEKARMQAVLDEETRRNNVARNRNEGAEAKFEHITLNNGKVLEHVTVRSFNDDGITFTTEAGASRVKWSDLPPDFVDKYRDPAAAKAAEAKAAQEAAVVQEVEDAGSDAELEYALETQTTDAALRGCVVKVNRVYKKGDWVSGNGQKIFVLNMGALAFENNHSIKVRLFPTGRQVKVGKKDDTQLYNLYVGSAGQALQFARDAGISISTMLQDHLLH